VNARAKTKAEEKRFRKFLEHHEFFAVTTYDPAKVDVWEVIAERGIPPEVLERIEKEFAASEFRRKVQLSLRRSVTGGKGRKFGGRGRSKKS
jgi:hypothetical protein